ncbi:MAG TPA: metallophosphoesterase [Acidobacteriota bacterium]
MALFAIGDLHLSQGAKPMDIFGAHWSDHENHLARHWRDRVGPDDTVLLLGDISWAVKLPQAAPHLEFIAALPGQKLMIKGNHDYWWSSRRKVESVLPPSLALIEHDSRIVEGIGLVGTRGWLCPGAEGFGERDQKTYDREVGRLAQAFEHLSDFEGPVIALLHFPPVNEHHEPSGFTAILEQHGACLCLYGHLHATVGWECRLEGERAGVEYRLVSSDWLDFRPWRVERERLRPRSALRQERGGSAALQGGKHR